MLSHYPPETPLPVFSQAHWHSDAVDNTMHGRVFDFGRPFFDQYHDLSRVVPRPALFTDYLRDENCSYTNYSGRNKNCYLIFDSDESHDCYYGYSVNGSRSSCDLFRVENLELCYEAVDSRNCYQCAFISDCDGCSDSFMLANCIGCKHCLMCSNLQQKEYYVLNERVSPERFHELCRSLRSATILAELRKSFDQLRRRQPQKAVRGSQNDNVLGNYLLNSKNAHWCFDCRDLRDGRYCFQTFMKANDCMDVDQVGEAQLCYECSNIGYNAYNCRFCFSCLNQISDLTYCEACFNGCTNLFGCIGLKRKTFCILNKQYSESDYRALLPRIVKHMEHTGEWGEFFPASISPFPYNLTHASFYFPLSKNEALGRGLRWRDDPEPTNESIGPQVPDSIDSVPDAILQQPLRCQQTGKAYKIIKQELELYRTLGVPLPRLCFDARHLTRLTSRTPRNLWERSCANCASPLRVAYDPAVGDIVHCEQCYAASLS